MDSYVLPAVRYEVPFRQARKSVLNTIIEDDTRGDERLYHGQQSKRKGARGRSRHLDVTRSARSISPVPSLTSSQSSIHHSQTQSHEFDDIYDVSDNESMKSHGNGAAVFSEDGSSRSVSPNGFVYARGDGKRCPSLIIPSPSFWPTVQKMQQPPPTSSPKVPISPANLSLLPYDQSTLSHPPSLDGSLLSDPLTRSTAPSTPDLSTPPTCIRIDGSTEKAEDYFAVRIQKDEPESFYLRHGSLVGAPAMAEVGLDGSSSRPDSPVLGSEAGDAEVGVQLSDTAFATLQQLTLEIPQTPKLPQASPEQAEMEEVELRRSRHNSVDFTPMSYSSECSLSQLSIPSPGGFFSSLNDGAQDTWRLPEPVAVPSSATAEHFYKRPWEAHIVEQIVEVADEGSEGELTARQPVTAIRVDHFPTREVEVTEMTPSVSSNNDFDAEYEKTIQESADKTLDRTSLWLANQTSYMAALCETNPLNDMGFSPETSTPNGAKHSRESSMTSPMKKVVRFLEEEARERPKPTVNESDPLYYHAFQHMVNTTRKEDTFLHRHARADAVQAARIGMPKQHVDCLLGSFEIASTSRVAPPRPVSMFPGKGEDTEQTEEQKLFATVDQERQALQQISSRGWAVESDKKLNGGKLFISPAASCLLELPARPTTGQPHILDLGGDANCGWAWHVAQAYPTAKVLTVSTTAATSDRLRGPRNHSRKVVSSLCSLPYPDNRFTVVSARNLFAHLKTIPSTGSNSALTEYDICLAECYRVLRPGGYLEFSLMDSDILHAGPRGTALSVEFGFNLKTRGYDPTPTKSFLSCIQKAGFRDVKRAWIFTPMGAPAAANTPTTGAQQLPETLPPDASPCNVDLPHLEAVVGGEVGSTAAVSPLTSLVGAWEWEKWLLKLQSEAGKDSEELIEDVATVMEEGKRAGAGWRCLKGWARK